MGEWLSYLGELFRPRFWRQIVTDPFAAVRQDPALAARAGLYAGGGALAAGVAVQTGAVGGAVRAAGAVARGAVGLVAAPFRAAAAAAPALSFAARHPVLTYLAVVNAELPLRIASAFQVQIQIGGAPPEIALPGRPLPSPVVRPPSRIPSRQDAWARLFQGQPVMLGR